MLAIVPFGDRIGERMTPTPGVGMFVHNLDASVDVFMWCISALEVLKGGITLPDIQTFLESPSGLKVFSETHMCRIPPNGIAWAPYGCVPLLLVGDAPGCVFVVCQPVHSAVLAATLDEDVKKAIISLNGGFLRKMSPISIQWEATSKAFNVLFGTA